MDVQGNAPTHPIQAPVLFKAGQNAEPLPAKEAEPVDEADDVTADEGQVTDDVDTGEDVSEDEGQHDEDDAAEEQEEELTIQYVVDGKPMTATLDEAKQALSSVKHLNKLRNEIVENNRKTTEVVKETENQRQLLVQRLQEAEALLMSGLPQPQDMQALLNAGDTAGYLKAQQAHQRFQQLQEYRKQEQAASEQARLQEQAQRMEAEYGELIESRPEFGKPEYAKKVTDFLMNDWGLTEQELAGLSAKALMLVDDARKWAEWNRNKSIGVKKAISKSVASANAPVKAPNADGIKRLSELKSKAEAGQANTMELIELQRLNKQVKG